MTAAVETIAPPRYSVAARRDWFAAFVFLLPNLVSIGLFTLIPVVAGFFLSFTNWDMLSDPQWVGLENYQDILKDRQFWNALRNTVIYTLIVIPGGLAVSMLLALALNSKIKGTAIYQAIFFLPYVSSTVAIALVWKWIYHPDYGVLNAMLRAVGLPGVDWLTNPSVALISVAIVQIWQTAGYNMVLLLAGLRAIPKDYYEAARIDGASPWTIFWSITVPLLMPTIFFVTTISIIASFQVFNLIYVMTGGGPGNSTKVYVFYLWENGFSFFKMGYASALAYVLFVIILAITLIQARFLGRTPGLGGR
ncbi:MAG: sugar ABC transporter permease [Devosia sp.]|uniref:carbohydrate ABC transporter permease n=1 Tax=Devosia sp. TaxID=1871048 RepID=UPI001A5AC2C6|nr:sugar ABC transporter permease [Devosia sp.]MBL8597511.1 sugar ABC transporter permease [Devosia sp.]